MKTWQLVLIIGISLSCGLSNNISKKKISINFNGQILLAIPPSHNLDTNVGIKSKVELLKLDSTLVHEFLTDDKGNFDEKVNIKKKWNPLILRITPILYPSISLKDKNGESVFSVYCSKQGYVEKWINLNSTERTIIKLDWIIISKESNDMKY